MSVKLLTEHHLEVLSLKGGYTGSSESTLVKMPHCWKSHVTAQMFWQAVHVNKAELQNMHVYWNNEGQIQPQNSLILIGHSGSFSFFFFCLSFIFLFYNLPNVEYDQKARKNLH